MRSIHPTAVVHPGARIAEGCFIGPYCIIGEHVQLAEGNRLHSHVVIDGYTQVGRGNEVYPFASLGLPSQDLKWKGAVTRVEIGEKNTFREHVTINSATADGSVTRIGSHNHVLAYAHIAHDCTVGNHVVMSNVATLAGHVFVEDHVTIGGLAAVHQFCRIGRMSFIGGCAKVVQDVPPYMLVDGNPAETRTINKVGLDRNNVPEDVQNGLKLAHRILFRDGLTISNALARMESELPNIPELKHLADFARSSERGLC
jgi:UDP-N-acetylglucosamine acyltransferase